MGNYLNTDLGDTICALATASGVGAIGIIRVSGKEAITLVNSVFEGRDLSAAISHTIHFGKIVHNDVITDEVLASIFIAPKSYTGENIVELSCHGSPYIQQKILEILVSKGARLAKPGEFTFRAFLNKKLDLAQAEAVADLIASNSEVSHRTAMQQMRGGFSQEIKTLREKLLNFSSLVELELDFSEEDVEFVSRKDLTDLILSIKKLIDSLLQSFKYGNAIKNGIPTVIAGKPNAGKSTLLNALVNEERSIVSEIEGTTRDTVEEAFVIDGVTFRLIDTAGIRAHTADIIEKIGIERTYDKIQKASIIIYIFDASKTSRSNLEKELSNFDGINALIIPVANKTDLCDLQEIKLRFNGLDVIFISSKNKENIEVLFNRLKDTVEKDKVKNDIIITNLRHYEALHNSGESLQSVLNGIQNNITGDLLAFEIRKASYHLAEITGEISTDDLLANIFSRFCIGK